MKREEQRPKWRHDETKSVGVDYTRAELVQRYDDMPQSIAGRFTRWMFLRSCWSTAGEKEKRRGCGISCIATAVC
ncbi:hypothetical protein C5S53_06000 [Methanophagales archaeon]|nr:hypothetical protein C5S53_06000 [Methanophagales archaeon]